MKKITKILLVVIGIILLTGCGKDSLQEISYNDLEKALNNKETFILEIAQDGCHNCEEFNPIFKKVLKKYNLTGAAFWQKGFEKDDIWQIVKSQIME